MSPCFDLFGRMLCNAIRIWILLSLLIWYVAGAGVSTHLTYLARVIPDKFQDYRPWLKAGAFFPDALYSCKPSEKLADFAERAHWPGFLISALALWQDRYGSSSKRDSEDSLRFQAFLIGVFSHQIVDSSWHSLVDGYESHGLLRFMAETEFDGNVEEAHNYLDVMGDFIVMSNVFTGIADPGWRYYTDTNWSLPREEDVMELLNRNGVDKDDISYQELNVCVMRGLSASLSEVYVTLNRRVEILNVAYGISPAAREIIQDCWQGGEFDIIAMLNACLPVYQSLFEPHTDLELQKHRLQICGNLPEVSRPLSKYNTNLDFHYGDGVVTVSSRVPRSNFGTSIAVGRFGQDKKLYAAVSAPLEESKGSVYLIALENLSKANTAAMKPFTPMKGLAVHTYRFNDTDFLVVSEPGSNCIHFYLAHKRILTIYDRAADAFQLQVSCVADIDGGFAPDLILSGPSYGRNETGCAILVTGSSLISYLNSDQPAEVEISALTTVRLNGGPFKKLYQHFGAALTSSSSYSPTGFLYVTCQSLGIVLAYSLGGLHSNSFPKYVIMEKDITLFNKYNYEDAELLPSSAHGMFGKTLLSWNYAGNSFIAISQHLFNSVFIYREIDGEVEFFLKLELKHDSSTSTSTIGFGSAIQYDEQLKLLYLSSPGSFDGKGAIWRVNMREVIDTVKIWKQDTLYMNAVSHLNFVNPQIDPRGFSNFGKTMQITPDRRVIIGVPQLNYGNLDAEQLTGAVIIK